MIKLPDLVLDYHRLKVPLDHPDRSVTRAKLEYPTANVTLAYLGAINKATVLTANGVHGLFIGTSDSFTDKAFEAVINVGGSAGTDTYMKVCVGGRVTTHKIYNSYLAGIATGLTTADFGIEKWVGRTRTTLGSEAVDIDVGTDMRIKISISGSTIKGFRVDMTTPKVTVTDTSLASGSFGGSATTSFDNEPQTGSILLGLLLAPSSPGVRAQAILEVDVLSKHEVPISGLEGLPEHLYVGVRRYEVLRRRGFTDDEVELLFGKPQLYVDLNSVTWGSFEFSTKSPTNIVMIYGDNPYRSGAIDRQVEYARSKNLKVISPPKDYREAVEQYNMLKKDFPHWLAGKDNYVYQVLGYELFELFQIADFYYGELIDHKTHYDQVKQVPPSEIESEINDVIRKLEKVTVLTERRDKHISKLKEVLKIGW